MGRWAGHTDRVVTVEAVGTRGRAGALQMPTCILGALSRPSHKTLSRQQKGLSLLLGGRNVFLWS